MSISESHSVLRQLIKIRSGDLALGIQAGDLAVAQIVSEKDDDIWALAPRTGEGAEQEGKKGANHDWRILFEPGHFCSDSHLRLGTPKETEDDP